MASLDQRNDIFLHKHQSWKRIKNSNDNYNDNDDDDDDDDNNNLSREEVSFDNVKNGVVTRNLYLLTCVLVYLLSYPPSYLTLV